MVLLAAGPASAHFCYLVNASDRSNAGRAGSNGWESFGDVAEREVGLCPAGAAVLARAAGVSVDTPILEHSTLANGTLRNGQGNDARGVAYLDFAAIGGAVDAALAACS